MLVTHYNPWLARGNAHARHVLARVFNAVDNDAVDTGREATAKNWSPSVDIREEAQRFVILADVPGIDPATIEIEMDKGVLSLKGERKAGEIGEGVSATRSERAHGKFQRRFTLPDSADAEQISASGRYGVLEISIPKKPETTPRRIAINA